MRISAFITLGVKPMEEQCKIIVLANQSQKWKRQVAHFVCMLCSRGERITRDYDY